MSTPAIDVLRQSMSTLDYEMKQAEREIERCTTTLAYWKTELATAQANRASLAAAIEWLADHEDTLDAKAWPLVVSGPC